MQGSTSDHLKNLPDVRDVERWQASDIDAVLDASYAQ